jgi:hypothetical protein
MKVTGDDEEIPAAAAACAYLGLECCGCARWGDAPSEAPDSIQGGSDVGLSWTTAVLQPSLHSHTPERLLSSYGLYLALPFIIRIPAAFLYSAAYSLPHWPAQAIGSCSLLGTNHGRMQSDLEEDAYTYTCHFRVKPIAPRAKPAAPSQRPSSQPRPSSRPPRRRKSVYQILP